MPPQLTCHRKYHWGSPGGIGQVKPAVPFTSKEFVVKHVQAGQGGGEVERVKTHATADGYKRAFMIAFGWIGVD